MTAHKLEDKVLAPDGRKGTIVEEHDTHSLVLFHTAGGPVQRTHYEYDPRTNKNKAVQVKTDASLVTTTERHPNEDLTPVV